MSTTGTDKEVVLRVTAASKRFSRSPEKARRPGAVEVFHAMIGRGKTQRSCDLRNDEFWAVKNVTFDLHRGEALGIVGLNGAGKSTLLKMILGRLRTDEGSIRTFGKAGGLIELGAGFHPDLSGRRNIYLNAAVLGATEKQVDEQLEAIIEFADIGPFIDSPVNTYSSGMRVRLGFAVTVHFVPDIVICDEVLAVGDFEFRQKCLQRIKEIRRTRSIVLVSHGTSNIALFCNRAMLIHHGEMIMLDEPRQVLKAYSACTQNMSADELREQARKVLEAEPTSAQKTNRKGSESSGSSKVSSHSQTTSKSESSQPTPKTSADQVENSNTVQTKTTPKSANASLSSEVPAPAKRSTTSRASSQEPVQGKQINTQATLPQNKEVRQQLFGPEYNNKAMITNVTHQWNLKSNEKGFFVFSGDTLTVNIRFELMAAVERFRIGFPIFDENGVMLLGPDSRDSVGITSISEPGTYSVTMKLEPLPLNFGRFWSALAISDDPAHLFRKHMPPFNVFNPNHEFGIVKTLPKWTLET